MTWLTLVTMPFTIVQYSPFRDYLQASPLALTQQVYSLGIRKSEEDHTFLLSLSFALLGKYPRHLSAGSLKETVVLYGFLDHSNLSGIEYKGFKYF
jgi:hypothetical protein